MAPTTRFLLVSTHTEQITGYSKVSYNILKQLATLQPVVKVFHFGFQKAQLKTSKPIRSLPSGIVQYDAALNEEPREEGFGFNKFKEYVDMVNPDIIFIYNDGIIVNRFLEALQLKDGKPSYKIWVYLDQVYKNLARQLVENIENNADKIFTFTDKWGDHLKSYLALESQSKVHTMEHGVDKSVFFRLTDHERQQVRTSMKIPSDAKVFLNVNRNSERKRLDLSIMAFIDIISRDPSTPYYMVFLTGAKVEVGGSYDLLTIYTTEIARRNMDINQYRDRIVIVDNSPPTLILDEAVNQIYNACDVGMNTSNGEGYGLCQLEHLATGAPQVVLDVGDYRAFMDDECAVFIQPTDVQYLPARFGLGLYSESATYSSVADGMLKSLSILQSVCVKKVSKHSWSRICDPFLEMVIQA